MSFADFIDKHGEHAEVLNLLMFFEGIWLWYQIHYNHPLYADYIVNRIRAIKTARGWDTVPRWSVFFKGWQKMTIFLELAFKTNLFDDNLEIEYDQHRNYTIVQPVSDKLKVIPCQELFSAKDLMYNDQRIRFQFKHPDAAYCRKPGRCGFIIKTTPPTLENPERFNIELCVDEDDYKDDAIHFHGDEVLADKMHLTVGENISTDPVAVMHVGSMPISWHHKVRSRLVPDMTNFVRAVDGKPYNPSHLAFKEVPKFTWVGHGGFDSDGACNECAEYIQYTIFYGI